MIEQFIIFTKTGTVLWSYKDIILKGDPINTLIKNVFMEDRINSKQSHIENFEMKWLFKNKFDLIFVVVYQKILQLLYIDNLLENVAKEIVSKYQTEIMSRCPIQYSERFSKILYKIETDPKTDALITKKRIMRHGISKKQSKIKDIAGKQRKETKKQTKWEESKLSNEEMEKLDRSKKLSKKELEDQVKEIRQNYVGNEADLSEDEESSNTSDSQDDNWVLKSSIGGFIKSLTGSKILIREDLEPAIMPLRDMLVSKNVASEIASELTESVITNLVGYRLESFTRISTVVKQALESALLRVLTPKRSVDILREIYDAKAEGRPYVIVFVGVNGVGKSTSLSKVCYYLKSKQINVMIAACDTFRSGAVEQLSQHAKVLDVLLYERGYAKDPANVAHEAIKHAKKNGYDCVLIDTAGRMQNNEPLMRSLAGLVSFNRPDLVLFVGEALVGNDGIDQLALFNRALIDHSTEKTPHSIDGIMLTKFDTIDDKVGAAVSMVYKTGQPIIFVGTGQKYTHLKRLNVKSVLNALLK